jgi:hypothetical protein
MCCDATTASSERLLEQGFRCPTANRIGYLLRLAERESIMFACFVGCLILMTLSALAGRRVAGLAAPGITPHGGVTWRDFRDFPILCAPVSRPACSPRHPGLEAGSRFFLVPFSRGSGTSAPGPGDGRRDASYTGQIDARLIPAYTYAHAHMRASCAPAEARLLTDLWRRSRRPGASAAAISWSDGQRKRAAPSPAPPSFLVPEDPISASRTRRPGSVPSSPDRALRPARARG